MSKRDTHKFKFYKFARNLTKLCLLKVIVSSTDEFYHHDNRNGWNYLLEQKNILRVFKLQRSIILFYIINKYAHGFLESCYACYLLPYLVFLRQYP